MLKSICPICFHAYILVRTDNYCAKCGSRLRKVKSCEHNNKSNVVTIKLFEVDNEP